MYYEEKVIDGCLCWRNQADAEWIKKTDKELTSLYMNLYNRTEELKKILNRKYR